MLDDRILAMLELSGDMFFHKIPKERCAYYIDAALDAGEQLEEKFAGLDIHSLYREFGIHIEYKERSGASYGVLLRGQIELSASSSVVLLYRASSFISWNTIPKRPWRRAWSLSLRRSWAAFPAKRTFKSAAKSPRTLLPGGCSGFRRCPTCTIICI